MTPVETTLLFVGNQALALENFTKSLNARLAKLNIEATEIPPPGDEKIAVRVADLQVSIHASSKPLPAENFSGAMDSPLSKPVIGLLTDILARHSRHLSITVSETGEDTENTSNLVTKLMLTHAVTSVLAERHMPAAIHWHQSNQLISGAQYLQLIPDPSPWALFAQARITSSGLPDQMVRNYGVRLDEAADFIERPIVFRECSFSPDQIHAATLSFLRHTVETGSPIPNGDTFGPKGGPIINVKHIPASTALPNGMFELSVDEASIVTKAEIQHPAPNASAARGMQLPLGHDLHSVAAPHPRERTRSMAISYLMLVIMPPVGAILLMSNAIFGSNFFRTSVIAACSVALAVAVGAYTFVSNGQNTALLFENELIKSVVLAD